jgi:hypothetical protein
MLAFYLSLSLQVVVAFLEVYTPEIFMQFLFYIFVFAVFLYFLYFLREDTFIISIVPHVHQFLYLPCLMTYKLIYKFSMELSMNIMSLEVTPPFYIIRNFLPRISTLLTENFEIKAP